MTGGEALIGSFIMAQNITSRNLRNPNHVFNFSFYLCFTMQDIYYSDSANSYIKAMEVSVLDRMLRDSYLRQSGGRGKDQRGTARGR